MVGKTSYRFRTKIPTTDTVSEKYRYQRLRPEIVENGFRNSEKFRNRFHP
jgi:hypothetical protein